MMRKLFFLVLILAAFTLVASCATALAYPNPFNSSGEEDGLSIDPAQNLPPPNVDKTLVSNYTANSTNASVAMGAPAAGQFSMVLVKDNDQTNRNSADRYQNAIFPGSSMPGSQHRDVMFTEGLPIATGANSSVREVTPSADLAGYDAAFSVYNVIAKSGANTEFAGTTFNRTTNTDSILAADIGPPSNLESDAWAGRGSPIQEVWQPNIGEKSVADNSSEDAKKIPKLGYSEVAAVVCENNLV